MAGLRRWPIQPRSTPRPKTIHTHHPSYSPSKWNIPDWSVRFFPLYPLITHSSSFISLLHPNYPHAEPTHHTLLLFTLLTSPSLLFLPPLSPTLPPRPRHQLLSNDDAELPCTRRSHRIVAWRWLEQQQGEGCSCATPALSSSPPAPPLHG
jgi:hypothetical protein